MTLGPDRLTLLRGHATLNGIDLIVVSDDGTQVLVYFINPPSAALELAIDVDSIVIAPAPIDGDPAPPLVRPDGVVTPIAWDGVGDMRHLVLTFAGVGPFSHQRLTLNSALMDSFFGTSLFNFKAGCPSKFDCAQIPECPDLDQAKPLIDYSARDFDSYRQALLDYAATAWPDWQERHLPDVSNMLVDLMAYLGAELAYFQDRVARETTLTHATQPRSVRAHARLMDYEIAPALGAHGLLDIQVDPAGTPAGLLEAGTPVWALTADSQEIPFEIGLGLADLSAPETFAVNAALNAVPPYLFDEDETCLPRGTTTFAIQGALSAVLPLTDERPDGTPSRTLLLRTDPEAGVTPESSGAPEKRILVVAIRIEDDVDPLVGTALTRITLAHPLPVDIDLSTLTVRGNLVPVSAGQTQDVMDVVVGRKADAPPGLPEIDLAGLKETIERDGPLGRPLHRVYLPGTDIDPLVWLSPDGTAPAARPAIELRSFAWDGVNLVERDLWTWRRSLLGSNSSLPDSLDFTLEDGKWDVVRRFDHLNEPFEWRDYAGPDGTTLRMGDGEFGLSPARGTLFQLRYKTGGGAASNVGADTIRHIDTARLPAGMEVAIANPFALGNGRDSEPLDEVRIAAPEAWKVETFRAVRPEDYTDAAERLEWVDRASTRSLWTGSWLSMFTTPDPADRSDLPTSRRAELEIWLDRFRMTGRDARVSDPVYADLDLEIAICVSAGRERSDLARAVRKRLRSDDGGFFDPDNTSFGDSLERAQLEAAIHDVGGVRAVESIRFRRRGWFDWRDLGTRYVPESTAEIIRVDNNPNRPDRGTITLFVEGGA